MVLFSGKRNCIVPVLTIHAFLLPNSLLMDFIYNLTSLAAMDTSLIFSGSLAHWVEGSTVAEGGRLAWEIKSLAVNQWTINMIKLSPNFWIPLLHPLYQSLRASSKSLLICIW